KSELRSAHLSPKGAALTSSTWTVQSIVRHDNLPAGAVRLPYFANSTCDGRHTRLHQETSRLQPSALSGSRYEGGAPTGICRPSSWQGCGRAQCSTEAHS